MRGCIFEGDAEPKASRRAGVLELVAVSKALIRGCGLEAVAELVLSWRTGKLELVAEFSPSMRGCIFEAVAEVFIVSQRDTKLVLAAGFETSTRAGGSAVLTGANVSARDDTLGAVLAGFMLLLYRSDAFWGEAEFAPSVRQSIVMPSIG